MNSMKLNQIKVKSDVSSKYSTVQYIIKQEIQQMLANTHYTFIIARYVIYSFENMNLVIV